MKKKGLHLIIRLAVVVVLLMGVSLLAVQPVAAASVTQIRDPAPLSFVLNDGSGTELLWWTVTFDNTPVMITHTIVDPWGQVIHTDSWNINGFSSPVFSPEDPTGTHQGDSTQPGFAHPWTVPYGAVMGTYTSYLRYYSFEMSGPVPDPNNWESESVVTFFVYGAPGVPVTIPTANGAGNATFSFDDGILTYLVPVAEGSLPVTPNKPPIDFPFGFFSFRIIGLTPGASVNVTLTLPSAIPPVDEYWKYDDFVDLWVNIPLTSNIDNVLTFTLTDNGQGDTDHSDNGVITDPGGPGVRAHHVPVSSGLAVGLMIAGLAALIAFAGFKRLKYSKE